MAGTARLLSAWLVCYDIANPKRLQKMAKLMEGFGRRLQYSVFVCYLDAAQYVRLKARVEALIDPKEDSVIYVPLCPGCRKRIEEVGTASFPDLTAPCVIV